MTRFIAAWCDRPPSVVNRSTALCVRMPAMRIDLYTKTILTVIALLLAVIALKPVLQPQPVMAQGNLSGVQFAIGGDHGYWFFDTKTGDIWEYKVNTLPVVHDQLTQLGKPLLNFGL